MKNDWQQQLLPSMELSSTLLCRFRGPGVEPLSGGSCSIPRTLWICWKAIIRNACWNTKTITTRILQVHLYCPPSNAQKSTYCQTTELTSKVLCNHEWRTCSRSLRCLNGDLKPHIYMLQIEISIHLTNTSKTIPDNCYLMSLVKWLTMKIVSHYLPCANVIKHQSTNDIKLGR